MYDLVKLLIEKSPNVLNTLIIATGPLLAAFLTYIIAKSGKEEDKKRDLKYKAEGELRDQEKRVFASLSRVLFNIQQLHVSLSGNCIDDKCITESIIKFDERLETCHREISENMLYMSSDVINEIYKFYHIIGNLKIALKEVDKEKQFELGHVTVHYYSKELAKRIINIQETFISERSDLKIEFKAARQEMMMLCCGQKPSPELEEKHKTLKEKLIKERLITE